MLKDIYQRCRQLYALCGEIYWRESILCSPAMLLVLFLSFNFEPMHAVAMVGAAFSVGFGASRTLQGYRWGAVVASVLGMALAAFAGSILGSEGVWLYVMVAILASCCAILTIYNNDLWWVSLQIVIAFLVASYYPQDIGLAMERAGLVLLGGGVQFLGMLWTAKLMPNVALPLPMMNTVRMSLRQQVRFVVATSLAVILSLWAARSAGLANDYWAAMTAILILRPDDKVTVQRAINRLMGTLVGCTLATMMIYCFDDRLVILMVGLVVTSAIAFSVQKAHYGLLSCVISATIVLLVALGHGNPIAITEHRIVATLLGGCVALLMSKLLVTE